MSVRNVLKVMMGLLLAVTLAATTAHAARLDQSFASVAAAGALNDRIPYLLCIRICTGVCTCDFRPVEYAECTCSRPGDSANSNKPAALLHTSEALQVKEKSENSGFIPYTECIKTCDKCACTRKWPPESNMCFCLDDDNVPKNAAAVADRFDQPLASVTEALQVKEKSENSSLIPYTECIKTCETCACTLIWPPERSMCFCLDGDNMPKNAAAVADRFVQPLASVTEKAHELYEKLALLAGPVPKRTSGDDKKMVLWTTSKLEGTIPYTECIKTCETCACTLIWPREASICVCGDPKPQVAGGKAVAK